jgi:hypothetical protein
MRDVMRSTYLLPRMPRYAHIGAKGGPTVGLALGGGYVQPVILSMGRLTGIGSPEPRPDDAPDTYAPDA